MAAHGEVPGNETPGTGHSDNTNYPYEDGSAELRRLAELEADDPEIDAATLAKLRSLLPGVSR
jgi:hypothetical protein